MAKKKKVAAKPAAQPEPEPEPSVPLVDFGTPHTSDEEGAAESTSTPKRDAPSSPHADQESSSRSSSSSSSSSEEASSHQGESSVAMTPGELAILLWTEETKANIRAIRQNRPQAPLSAASAAVALSISRHDAALVHEAAMASEVGPVSSAEVENSGSSSISTAAGSVSASSLPLVDQTVSTTSASAARAAVQSVGGTQPPSANPPNPLLSSANRTNPSSDSLVARPLPAEVAAVAVTAADLRGVPRLTGSSDQNVPEILSHFRVIVGLKAKRVRPNDDNFGDMVALEHIALLGEGHCLTLIQQLVTGQIDTSKATASSEPDTPGSFTPPSTWHEMTQALLDLLMPANSIDECARQIAIFNQKGAETVSAYAMRFRTILSQFQAAVDRVDDNRTTWNAMTVALWQQGLKPSVRCLQLTDKPATSLKEAIDRARRHEASGLAGGHVSALYHQVPHRGLDGFPPLPPAQKRSTGARGKGGGGSGSGPQGKRAKGRSSSSNRSPPVNQPDRVCTHPTCLSKKGHTIDQCWTRSREEREAGNGASSAGGKGKKKKKKRTPSSEDDDDSE